MLSRPHRLLGKDFTQIKHQGKPTYGRFITLLVAPAPSPQTPTRFGFIVSTKVAPLATRRNRLKRQLRQSARGLIPLLNPGRYIIVIAQKTIVNQPPSQLTRELKRLLQSHFLPPNPPHETHPS